MFHWLQNKIESKITVCCQLCLNPCLLSNRLCNLCLARMPYNYNACFCCAIPLLKNEISKFCGACLTQSKPIATSVVPLLYKYPVSPMLGRFKYHNALEYSASLTPLLAYALKNHYRENAKSMPECIIPIPLYSKRLLERGFNQAGLIAKHLKNRLSIKVVDNFLIRSRSTQPLSDLSAKARQKALKGAFKISQKINYSHVAIVDDIVTSGATVNAAANALLRAGIKKVDVWAIARTPL